MPLTKVSKGFKSVPLENLAFLTYGEIAPPYEVMMHLTNLTVDDHMEVCLLNSPLKNLKLDFTSDSDILLNSLTFESCFHWNVSLIQLEISVSPYQRVWLEGSPFQWFTELRILLISGSTSNNYLTFSENAFIGLQNLAELHVEWFITNIFDSRALTVFSNNSKLQVLELTSNYFTKYVEYDQLCLNSSIDRLVFSDNMWLNFTFYPEAFKCIPPPHLEMFTIESQVFWESFDMITLCQGSSSLKQINARTRTTIPKEWKCWIFMDPCTLETCRCPNLEQMDLSGNVIHYKGEDELFMPSLEQLWLQQVQQFISRHSAKPEVVDVVELMKIFKAPKLRFLDLSLNQISVIDEQGIVIFSNLTYLDLRYNQLTSLYCTFLNSLVYLDVSYNKLSSIDNAQHLEKIETLYLNDNEINIVPPALLSASHTPAMHTLDLNSNPLICDCSVETLQRCLFTDNVVRLHDYHAGENVYRCSYPDSEQGLSVTEVTLDCDLPILMYVSVSITCFLVITTFLVVWYRWHIQYRLFLLFHRRRNFQNNLVDDDIEDEDGPPRYDAYVTYHRQDEDWVGDELEANIEGGEEPFRLCIKNRDIQAGRLIFNAISQCIQRSRKILVILSPCFVDDNWCHFQLNMAHHRVLEENSSVLIFIILEDIPNNKLTLLLRQLFCKAKCLKWPADEYGRNLFWQRLREELKRPVPLDRRIYV